MNSSAGWSAFSIPISQFSMAADSLEILILGGKEAASSLYLDELSLLLNTIVDPGNPCELEIFPNPFTDFITVNPQVQAIRKFFFGYLFFHRRSCTKIEARSAPLEIGRDNLASGIYLLRLNANGRTAVEQQTSR
jgi:hypothetical protein